MSCFQKFLFLSTRADISGVIFNYTWDTFFWDTLHIPSVPKKVPCLINNRTKAFCLISEMLFALDERDPKLDFDILFFSFG